MFNVRTRICVTGRSPLGFPYAKYRCIGHATRTHNGNHTHAHTHIYTEYSVAFHLFTLRFPRNIHRPTLRRVKYSIKQYYEAIRNITMVQLKAQFISDALRAFFFFFFFFRTESMHDDCRRKRRLINARRSLANEYQSNSRLTTFDLSFRLLSRCCNSVARARHIRCDVCGKREATNSHGISGGVKSNSSLTAALFYSHSLLYMSLYRALFSLTYRRSKSIPPGYF